MHRIRHSFGVAIAAMIVVAGCDGSSEANTQAEWVTIDGVEFPTILAQAPPDVVEIYVFAAKHPEVLEYMPCYTSPPTTALSTRSIDLDPCRGSSST
jgi:hypothetical protein